MKTFHNSLLCELHAHTTWSDGELSLDQVVDVYGRAGYDVLCITDHVVRGQTMVTEDAFVPYLRAIERAADRARLEYGMLVIPGLELTWDDPDPGWAAHAVCVGVHRFIGLDDGLEAALDRAESQGAAIIAAHPHSLGTDRVPGRTTRRWWLDRDLRARAHRFELINRHQTFDWIASSELPAVANGDFHTLEHLDTWKTVLPAPRTTSGVISYLRSSRPALIVKPGEYVLPPQVDLESLIGVPA